MCVHFLAPLVRLASQKHKGKLHFIVTLINTSSWSYKSLEKFFFVVFLASLLCRCSCTPSQDLCMNLAFASFVFKCVNLCENGLDLGSKSVMCLVLSLGLLVWSCWLRHYAPFLGRTLSSMQVWFGRVPPPHPSFIWEPHGVFNIRSSPPLSPYSS